jgi:uncharacterized cupredoxin-like copper-binding protein
VLLAAVAATVGSVRAWATGTRAQATVKATLVEWNIKLSTKAVPAGKVTFVVKNAGFKEHEFVVIRTNRAPNALPIKGSRASEAGHQGEIQEFRPGLTKTLTLTLRAGKYVLICNVLRHYQRGQRTGFTVK